MKTKNLKQKFGSLPKLTNLEYALKQFRDAISKWEAKNIHKPQLTPGQGMQLICVKGGDYNALFACQNQSFISFIKGSGRLFCANISLDKIEEFKDMYEHIKYRRDNVAHEHEPFDIEEKLGKVTHPLLIEGKSISFTIIHPGMSSDKDKERIKKQEEDLPKLKIDFDRYFIPYVESVIRYVESEIKKESTNDK